MLAIFNLYMHNVHIYRRQKMQQARLSGKLSAIGGIDSPSDRPSDLTTDLGM